MSKIQKKTKGEKDLIFEDFIEEKVLSGLSQNTITDYRVSYRRFVLIQGTAFAEKKTILFHHFKAFNLLER